MAKGLNIGMSVPNALGVDVNGFVDGARASYVAGFGLPIYIESEEGLAFLFEPGFNTSISRPYLPFSGQGTIFFGRDWFDLGVTLNMQYEPESTISKFLIGPAGWVKPPAEEGSTYFCNWFLKGGFNLIGEKGSSAGFSLLAGVNVGVLFPL